jgi:hypothetical protein
LEQPRIFFQLTTLSSIRRGRGLERVPFDSGGFATALLPDSPTRRHTSGLGNGQATVVGLATADGGMSRRAATGRFGVSISSVILKDAAVRRATGSFAPNPQGGDARSQQIEAQPGAPPQSRGKTPRRRLEHHRPHRRHLHTGRTQKLLRRCRIRRKLIGMCSKAAGCAGATIETWSGF